MEDKLPTLKNCIKENTATYTRKDENSRIEDK